jgi:hypothetical protein
MLDCYFHFDIDVVDVNNKFYEFLFDLHYPLFSKFKYFNNKLHLELSVNIQKVIPENLKFITYTQLRTTILDFNQSSSQSQTITVAFSTLINQLMMLIQTIQQGLKYRNAVNMNLIIYKFLPTDASYGFQGRYLEVISLDDSAVGSGQPAEIKQQTLGTSGLILRQT